MNALRARSVAEARLQLVQRSAAQRAALVARVAAAARAIARVRSYLVMVAALAGIAALLGRRRVFGLATRALTVLTRSPTQSRRFADDSPRTGSYAATTANEPP